jgi:hypothetical protein
MRQTPDEITQNVAERVCWEVAQRDDRRVARRLSRNQEVEGVYRLDEGAGLDDVCHFLDQIGVLALLAETHGTALQREMVPSGQYVLLDGLTTLCGMDRMNALPALLCSDEALRQRVGFNAQPGRQGVCHRGAATRQRARTPGPISPETLAHKIGTLHGRDREVVCNGAGRALAQAKVFGAKVTGLADGTDLETTERSTGCGQVTRQRRITDRRGREPEIERTVYGWTVLLLSAAATKMPLAVQVGPIQAHEPPGTRALVTQARANLGGAARLHKLVCDRGFVEGTDLWWLDQQGLTLVVPAQDTRAVTAEARAQPVVGEELTVGRRGQSVRHGQGREAWTERLETEVVGMTGLTTDDQSGTPEPGRQGHRRDVQAHPINAVVVRQWHGRDDGPAGTTVFLTNAAVDTPLRPCDDEDDRRLIEHCCSKEATPPWALGHPPQKTERAVRGHGLFTLLMCALAPAYRLPCEREARGGEPVGWQRWRRQLLEQTREQVIVCAQGADGLFQLAEYSLLLGVKLQDLPPGLGTRQEILAK